jgi:hypothetical protein
MGGKQTRVEILGKPYRLVEIEAASAPDFSGTYNREAQTITITSGLAPESREDAILHETTHIISDELCLKLTEEQVGALACGLYSAGCRVALK